MEKDCVLHYDQRCLRGEEVETELISEALGKASMARLMPRLGQIQHPSTPGGTLVEGRRADSRVLVSAKTRRLFYDDGDHKRSFEA